jgi:ATP-dependent Clp protease ATP-binding subunit ClpL
LLQVRSLQRLLALNLRHVEGLAQAIVEGNVPAAIKDKEIISIDISSLEAGTQYRGAFEENIQNYRNHFLLRRNR